MKWLIKTGERIYGSGACRIQQLLTTLFSAGGQVEKFSAAALSSPKEIQLLDNNSLNASDEDDVNQSSWLTWGVASWAFLINICEEKKVLRAEKKLNCYIKAWKDVKTLGFYSIFQLHDSSERRKDFLIILFLAYPPLIQPSSTVLKLSPLAHLGMGQSWI